MHALVAGMQIALVSTNQARVEGGGTLAAENAILAWKLPVPLTWQASTCVCWC